MYVLLFFLLRFQLLVKYLELKLGGGQMKQLDKMNDEMYKKLKAELELLQTDKYETSNQLNWEEFCTYLEEHSQFSHKEVDNKTCFVTFYFHNTGDGPEFLTLGISKNKSEEIRTEKSWVRSEDWFNSLYEKAKVLRYHLNEE